MNLLGTISMISPVFRSYKQRLFLEKCKSKPKSHGWRTNKNKSEIENKKGIMKRQLDVDMNSTSGYEGDTSFCIVRV